MSAAVVGLAFHDGGDGRVLRTRRTPTGCRRRDRVAAFGTLFLDRFESLGALRAYTSAEAFSVCAWALAGTAAVGAVSGLVLRRR
ncbi:hypothetical protein Scel_61190 [Streptomyces cellostaticus]|nr:hypothetical protein Scel_61190 [Streptomyces cellostaticus]